jgi:hypothetical protein
MEMVVRPKSREFLRNRDESYAARSLPQPRQQADFGHLEEGGMAAAVRFVIVGVLAALLSALFPVHVYAQPVSTRVALLAADDVGAAQNVSAHLTAAGFDVTVIDAGATTPTLEDLASFHVVFTWSNAPQEFPYANPAALGDVLASFVDSGRGVVQAGSSLFSMAPFGLSGRWTSGRYGAFSSGWINFGGVMTLNPTLPSHPILAGVSHFNGGNVIPFMNVAPQGCGDVVARWSNGARTPFVGAGAGPNGGRVVALNFYPVSGEQYWHPDTTNGEELLANSVSYAASAVPHATGPGVAIVAADEAARVSDVRCKLHNLEMFSRIDVIDAQSSTPALATLFDYSAVLTWTGSSYGDADAMGDVLADYVDAHGGVVHSPVSFSNGPQLGGRWNADYNPLVEGNAASESDLHLQPFGPLHAILAGVGDVDNGVGGHHTLSGVNTVPGEAAPTVVANWTNGQPMAVFKKKPAGGHVASVNMFPPSSDAFADSWNRHSGGARLMANMLMFVSNHAPTIDAGGDQTVEATAAGVPVTLTAAVADADGDPLTLAWSGVVATSTTVNSITFTAGPLNPSEPSRTYTVTVTVTDGKGGEATDVVNVVLTDTAAPVIAPTSNLTVPATGPDGAMVSYGPVTASDAADGSVPVNCSPLSGSFPVGDTVVTCSATDSRGHTSTSSFTVTVTPDDGGGEEPVTPGKVIGYGYIHTNAKHHEFAFNAVERPSGADRGGLILTVKTLKPAYRYRYSRWSIDRFVSKTVDSVAFTNSSAVLFSGTGRWNGLDGYQYEVSAAEGARVRRRDDSVRITIKSPGGTVVAYVDGTLDGGNIEFLRQQH